MKYPGCYIKFITGDNDMRFQKIFILLLIIMALPGCTVLGLALDTKMCGDYYHKQNDRFSMAHNEPSEEDKGCKPIFTPLGFYLDMQVIKGIQKAG